MKIVKYVIMTLFLIALSISSAQVPKKVLMEYATNASCGPCASFNPGNYEFLTSQYKYTTSVWYHAWWPGPNDPMYLANIDENAARINYYNINGVPDYVLNGTKKGWKTNNLTADLENDHLSLVDLESPVELKVNTNLVGDSLEIMIKIKVFGEVTYSDLVLHTAITERMVNYPTPPGSNGEIEFPHVFRKFCVGSSGDPIPNLTIGDSLQFIYREKVDSSWNKADITIVTWVQSKSSKTVIQTTSDLFYYKIASSIPEFDFISKNETTIKNYSIDNILDETLKLRIRSNTVENDENYSFALRYADAPFDWLDVTIEPGDTFDFELHLQTNDNTGTISIDIIAENMSEVSNFKSQYFTESSTNYYGVVTSGDILIVDDDGGYEYEENYSRYFNSRGKEFTKLSLSSLLKIKNDFDLSNFNYLFWNLGIESPALGAVDATMLTDYLKNGGNLFIAGQDLGYDIHEITRLTNPRFLYSIYFDAQYLANTDSSNNIKSIPGNPLFDDLTIELNDIYPASPDAIQSKRGNSIPVLKYSDSENAAMLIHVKDDAKIAYLAFGLEQISSASIQDSILNAVISWFDLPTGIESTNSFDIPTKYELNQNYPNPFNPVTLINYQIVKKGKVELKVYDLLGRVLRTLVNEFQEPGNYSVNFQAEELNSGVYFYSIKTNDFIDTKKMLLLK